MLRNLRSCHLSCENLCVRDFFGVVAFLTGSNGPTTGLNYMPEGRKIHCGLPSDSRDFHRSVQYAYVKKKGDSRTKWLGIQVALAHILYTTIGWFISIVTGRRLRRTRTHQLHLPCTLHIVQCTPRMGRSSCMFYRSRIHESTISLRFLVILLRVCGGSGFRLHLCLHDV